MPSNDLLGVEVGYWDDLCIFSTFMELNTSANDESFCRPLFTAGGLRPNAVKESLRLPVVELCLEQAIYLV